MNSIQEDMRRANKGDKGKGRGHKAAPAMATTMATTMLPPAEAATTTFFPVEKYNFREPKPNEIPNFIRAAVPIFEEFCYIAIHASLIIYETPTFKNPLDLIPRRSIVQFLWQETRNKHICLVSYGPTRGYVNIIQNQSIVVQKDDRKTVRVNFQELPSSVVAASATTMNQCLCNYSLKPNMMCQILFSTTMKKSPDSTSPPVGELIPRTPVIILAFGEGERAFVRPLSRFSQAGWIPIIDQRRRPLLGFFIPSVEVALVEIGARMEIQKWDKITKSEPEASEEIGKVATGTIAFVTQGPSMGSTEHRFKIATEPIYLTGWVSVKVHKALVLGILEKSLDPEISHFFYLAMRNDVHGLAEQLTPPVSKWYKKTPKLKTNDINCHDGLKRTAIFYAAGFGNLKALQFLLQYEVNLNYSDYLDLKVRDTFRRSPLHYACSRMHGAPIRTDGSYCVWRAYFIARTRLESSRAPTLTWQHEDNSAAAMIYVTHVWRVRARQR